VSTSQSPDENQREAATSNSLPLLLYMSTRVFY
jgi:hypothetical protein